MHSEFIWYSSGLETSYTFTRVTQAGLISLSTAILHCTFLLNHSNLEAFFAASVLCLMAYLLWDVCFLSVASSIWSSQKTVSSRITICLVVSDIRIMSGLSVVLVMDFGNG